MGIAPDANGNAYVPATDLVKAINFYLNLAVDSMHAEVKLDNGVKGDAVYFRQYVRTSDEIWLGESSPVEITVDPPGWGAIT